MRLRIELYHQNEEVLTSAYVHRDNDPSNIIDDLIFGPPGDEPIHKKRLVRDLFIITCLHGFIQLLEDSDCLQGEVRCRYEDTGVIQTLSKRSRVEVDHVS